MGNKSIAVLSSSSIVVVPAVVSEVISGIAATSARGVGGLPSAGTIAPPHGAMLDPTPRTGTVAIGRTVLSGAPATVAILPGTTSTMALIPGAAAMTGRHNLVGVEGSGVEGSAGPI